MSLCVHYPKNNLDFHIKTCGAEATVYVWFLRKIYDYKNQTYTVAFGSSCDRLSFYSEIQITFCTVCCRWKLCTASFVYKQCFLLCFPWRRWPGSVRSLVKKELFLTSVLSSS